jgi:hypothetical protein
MASVDRQRFYGSRFWKRRAKLQLRIEPMCRMCAAIGEVRLATVADHVQRWTSPNEFYCSEIQSLCTAHHNRDKQRIELGRMPKLRIADDGTPIEFDASEPQPKPWGR